MRFMMLMYPGAKAETGALPDEQAIAQMMKYNEELTKAGVLLALDGLWPTAKGARIQHKDGKRQILDGPFSEAKEVLGGYWMLQVKSRAEALEWASRAPLAEGEAIELRQVYEMADFAPSPELDQTAARVEAGMDANKRRAR